MCVCVYVYEYFYNGRTLFGYKGLSACKKELGKCMQTHWKSCLIKSQGHLSKLCTRISFRVLNRPCMSHLCSVRNELRSLLPHTSVMFCRAQLSYSQHESLQAAPPTCCQELVPSYSISNKSSFKILLFKDSRLLLSNQNKARLLLADNFTTISQSMRLSWAMWSPKKMEGIVWGFFVCFLSGHCPLQTCIIWTSKLKLLFFKVLFCSWMCNQK